MLDLFGSDVQRIPLDGGELLSYPSFLSADVADQLFSSLQQRVSWQQSTLRLADRKTPVPRLNAWYGDSRARYGYSGLVFELRPWLPELRGEFEMLGKGNFNRALINLYRNGNDSVAWHRDDEPELGKQPVITSISLGAVCQFECETQGE